MTATGEITKNSTLATTFHKPAGEENPCFRFGYSPQKNFNHTQEKVSVSMKTDPINMIHTSQQSTKEGLNKDLGVGFVNSK